MKDLIRELKEFDERTLQELELCPRGFCRRGEITTYKTRHIARRIMLSDERITKWTVYRGEYSDILPEVEDLIYKNKSIARMKYFEMVEFAKQEVKEEREEMKHE